MQYNVPNVQDIDQKIPAYEEQSSSTWRRQSTDTNNEMTKQLLSEKETMLVKCSMMKANTIETNGKL